MQVFKRLNRPATIQIAAGFGSTVARDAAEDGFIMEDKLSNFQPLHYMILTCIVSHF